MSCTIRLPQKKDRRSFWNPSLVRFDKPSDMVAKAAQEIRLYASGLPFTALSNKKEETEVSIRTKNAK